MDINSLSKSLNGDVFKMPFPDPDGRDLFAKQVDDVWTVTTDSTDANPVTLHLVSKESPQYRAARRTLDAAIMKDTRQPANKQMSEDEKDEKVLRTICAAVVGWDYMVWNDDPQNGGEPYLLDFTPANALMVLGAYSPARTKADQETQNLGNFGKVS